MRGIGRGSDVLLGYLTNWPCMIFTALAVVSCSRARTAPRTTNWREVGGRTDFGGTTGGSFCGRRSRWQLCML